MGERVLKTFYGVIDTQVSVTKCIVPRGCQAGLSPRLSEGQMSRGLQHVAALELSRAATTRRWITPMSGSRETSRFKNPVL